MPLPQSSPWSPAPPADPPAHPAPGLPPPPVRRRATAAAPSAELLGAVLDQLDTGVLLVDGGGFVLLASQAARAELQQADLLRVDAHGHLGVAGGPSHVALRAAMAAAVTDQLHQLLPLRAGARTLTVAVQPLRVPGHAPLALVLLPRRQFCPSLVVEMLAGQHALTLAERRLLVALLEGRRIAEVAAAHGVQVSTVRSQASALRTKFGVHRLEDLTRLAAELPPMGRPLQGLLTTQASPRVPTADRAAAPRRRSR